MQPRIMKIMSYIQINQKYICPLWMLSFHQFLVFPYKLQKKICFLLMAEGREGGDVLCCYIPYSKNTSLILSSLHICHFTTHCAVLFTDMMNCWLFSGPCRWDETTTLRVPVDEEFAKIEPHTFGHQLGYTNAASVSCICWRLRLPCRSSKECICEVSTNCLVTLTQVKTRGVQTCAE